MLGCLPVFAGVSEPDNIVYGTITLDNVQIKADRTDVIVEARRTINGPAIASYQMGSDPRVGNNYALRIPIESASPVFDPDASLAGDSLFIVVRDGTGVRVQASYTVANRATVQRLDFGAAVSDSDNDGLPDAWELLNFGTLNQAGNSVNLNGQTTLQNYIAGTNPNDTNSTFMVDVNVTNNMRQVSFMALRAQGTGYEGMTRYYSLEYRTNAGAGSWLGVSGYVNVPGSNQTILYQSVATNSILFFRGRTWLQGQ